EIMSLSRDSLSHVLLDFPEEQMRFRKAATLMALFAVAKIYRVELVAEERDPHNRWIHDVFETARKIGLE
ncbi:Kcnh1, partial [Symbiodinium pilosum]